MPKRSRKVCCMKFGNVRRRVWEAHVLISQSTSHRKEMDLIQRDTRYKSGTCMFIDPNTSGLPPT